MSDNVIQQVHVVYTGQARIVGVYLHEETARADRYLADQAEGEKAVQRPTSLVSRPLVTEKLDGRENRSDTTEAETNQG